MDEELIKLNFNKEELLQALIQRWINDRNQYQTKWAMTSGGIKTDNPLVFTNLLEQMEVKRK